MSAKITIKAIKEAIKHNENVFLVGPHGVGKTFMVKKAVDEGGWNMIHMDASLIDPYIDLVGIPEVMEENGKKVLKQVRKDNLDDVEVLFIDEFSRGSVATLNGIFQLIQFRAINGVKLPNLKCVIAASNPMDDERYTGLVELDEALLDRFDRFYEVMPDYSVKYLTGSLGDKDVASALVQWADTIDPEKAGYISPRRLEKLGQNYLTYHSKTNLESALPMGGHFSINDLWARLNSSVTKDDIDSEDQESKKVSTSDLKSPGFVRDNYEKISDLAYEKKLSEEQLEILGETMGRIGIPYYNKDGFVDLICQMANNNAVIPVTRSKMGQIKRDTYLDPAFFGTVIQVV